MSQKKKHQCVNPLRSESCVNSFGSLWFLLVLVVMMEGFCNRRHNLESFQQNHCLRGCSGTYLRNILQYLQLRDKIIVLVILTMSWLRAAGPWCKVLLSPPPNHYSVCTLMGQLKTSSWLKCNTPWSSLQCEQDSAVNTWRKMLYRDGSSFVRGQERNTPSTYTHIHHSHTYSCHRCNLKSLINLMYMFLLCGRKLGHMGTTWERHIKGPRLQPRSFLLWGDSPHHRHCLPGR